MTRINTIDPRDLLDQHLTAEWRELPRIVNELIKYPKRFNIKDIPDQFTLNTGHVKFFRNKLLFLKNRHQSIIDEMIIRGIDFDRSIVVNLDSLAPHIKMFGCNDWQPTKRDHAISIERIEERFDLRKRAYHFTVCQVKHVVNCEHSFNNYFKNLGKYF